MIKEKIRKKAKLLGFDLVGFSSCNLPDDARNFYQEWLSKGFEGDMNWMDNDLRLHPENLLDGVQSIIVLSVNYYNEQNPLRKGHGRIARYAQSEDYHSIIRTKLNSLVTFIHEGSPGEKSRGFVDSGPVLERTFAEMSGLGSIGKNSCLITKEFGSWVFLSVILTTIDFKAEKEKKSRFSVCGSCNKCITSCPTQAIVASGVVDSKKCLAYLTIEKRDSFTLSEIKMVRNAMTLFGCDICQEVCPHNLYKQKSSKLKIIVDDQIKPSEILKLNEKEFKSSFKESPLMRAKHSGLVRNARTLMRTLQNV
jgi:epoxyqueuosine reductase